MRSLPFPQPDRLVAIYSQDDLSKPDSGNVVASGDVYDWQKASHGYEQMAIWRWIGLSQSFTVPTGCGSLGVRTTLPAAPATGTAHAITVTTTRQWCDRRVDSRRNQVGAQLAPLKACRITEISICCLADCYSSPADWLVGSSGSPCSGQQG